MMTTMSLLLTLCSDFVFTGVVFHRWMMALLLGAQRLGRDSLHTLVPPIYSAYVLTLLAEHFAVGCLMRPPFGRIQPWITWPFIFIQCSYLDVTINRALSDVMVLAVPDDCVLYNFLIKFMCIQSICYF